MIEVRTLVKATQSDERDQDKDEAGAMEVEVSDKAPDQRLFDRVFNAGVGGFGAG